MVQVSRTRAEVATAYDDLEVGRPPRAPIISVSVPSAVDATVTQPGYHTVTVFIFPVSGTLREGSWDQERAPVAQALIDQISAHTPKSGQSILRHWLRTPLDLACENGLTDGCIWHVPHVGEQLFWNLSLPELARYRTRPHDESSQLAHSAVPRRPKPDVIAQIKTAAQYPDRLILFGNVDPRHGGNSSRTDFGWIFERFVAIGCVGIGEVTANLEADDPRVVNMFRHCGIWQMPVLFHGTGRGEGHHGLIDDVGSPHLEHLLQQVPETIVIGHGQGFWAEIGTGGLTEESKSRYPVGPIEDEGSLIRLLRTYPNLYADISAESGYNALTQEEPFGHRFLNDFQDKLIFGTDVAFGDMQGREPHLSYLRRLRSEGHISADVFEKITLRNALHVLTQYATAERAQ
jgi:predicted TIM-barrel fold metal-dependent hydrolase